MSDILRYDLLPTNCRNERISTMADNRRSYAGVPTHAGTYAGVQAAHFIYTSVLAIFKDDQCVAMLILNRQIVDPSSSPCIHLVKQLKSVFLRPKGVMLLRQRTCDSSICGAFEDCNEAHAWLGSHHLRRHFGRACSCLVLGQPSHHWQH